MRICVPLLVIRLTTGRFECREHDNRITPMTTAAVIPMSSMIHLPACPTWELRSIDLLFIALLFVARMVVGY